MKAAKKISKLHFPDDSWGRMIFKSGFKEGVKWAAEHPKWISVDTCLPLLGDQYNVVRDIKDGLGGPVVGTLEWDAVNKIWCYWGDTTAIQDVTYWANIPKPPKKK